jgi:prevent-host-death family protein
MVIPQKKGDKMQKTIAAIKARQNLGQIMNEVSLRGDDYIIERAGKPLVAIISMEEYTILQRARDDARQSLDKIWDKMGKDEGGQLDNIINEAVQAARRA